MKKSILKTLSAISLSIFIHTTAHAGAEIIVNLNNGDVFKWQFFDIQEASEFLSDRVDSGHCSPKVANIEIRSVWIDGIDSIDDKFAYYHGIENQKTF